MRPSLSLLMVELLIAGSVMSPVTASAQQAPAAGTITPIKHLVVIFQENISFDHYFGTYPNATNPQGEPVFTPLAGTPSVNGLDNALLTVNPNVNSANGLGESIHSVLTGRRRPLPIRITTTLRNRWLCTTG